MNQRAFKFLMVGIERKRWRGQKHAPEMWPRILKHIPASPVSGTQYTPILATDGTWPYSHSETKGSFAVAARGSPVSWRTPS